MSKSELPFFQPNWRTLERKHKQLFRAVPIICLVTLDRRRLIEFGSEEWNSLEQIYKAI